MVIQDIDFTKVMVNRGADLTTAERGAAGSRRKGEALAKAAQGGRGAAAYARLLMNAPRYQVCTGMFGVAKDHPWRVYRGDLGARV